VLSEVPLEPEVLALSLVAAASHAGGAVGREPRFVRREVFVRACAWCEALRELVPVESLSCSTTAGSGAPAPSALPGWTAPCRKAAPTATAPASGISASARLLNSRRKNEFAAVPRIDVRSLATVISSAVRACGRGETGVNRV